MANIRRAYWDSTMFISFLSDTHPREKIHADIAEDILHHAKDGKGVEIWTSVWTIAEVIRPKSPIPDAFPMPVWAELLDATDDKGAARFPRARPHFTQIWEYYSRNTLPDRLIAEADAKKIRLMFDWPWINVVDFVPAVAHKAADIMRTHNMKAGDAVHVATALYRSCDVIHCWDKDFSKTDGLIGSVHPVKMSPDIPHTRDLFD